MEKEVEIKFKSKVDDYELEFIYDGLLIEEDIKILKYKEEIDDQIIDTSIIFEDTIIINRSNGIEMFQEFIVGQTTVMDYEVNGLVINFLVNTKEIINKDKYLKIIYSTEVGEIIQEHEIEIYY